MGFWQILVGGSNDRKFLEIFEQHALNTHECAKALASLFGNTPFGDKQAIERVIKFEHLGDQLTKETHLLLDETFITKIDKTDIAHLITELDNTIDLMKEAALLIQDYNITAGRVEATELTEIIIQITALIPVCITRLTDLNLTEHKKQVIAIKVLEEKADKILRRLRNNLTQEIEALPAPISGHTILHDTLMLLRWEKVCEALEEVTDHSEHVSHIISSIIRKLC